MKIDPVALMTARSDDLMNASAAPGFDRDNRDWEMLSVSTMMEFIAGNQWTYARTMLKHPHEYVQLSRCTSEERFFRFVMTIRRFGYDESFNSLRFRSLDIDDRRYWRMGDLLATTTWVLNRAVNSQPDTLKVLNPVRFVTNPPNNERPLARVSAVSSNY